MACCALEGSLCLRPDALEPGAGGLFTTAALPAPRPGASWTLPVGKQSRGSPALLALPRLQQMTKGTSLPVRSQWAHSPPHLPRPLGLAGSESLSSRGPQGFWCKILQGFTCSSVFMTASSRPAWRGRGSCRSTLPLDLIYIRSHCIIE